MGKLNKALKNRQKNEEKPMRHFEIVIGNDGQITDLYEIDKSDPVQITKDLIYKQWGVFIANESEEESIIKKHLEDGLTPSVISFHLKVCIEAVNSVNDGNILSEVEEDNLYQQIADDLFDKYYELVN